MGCVYCLDAFDATLDQGMLCHEWVGSWMVGTHDDISGKVHIQLLSCEDTGEVGSYGSAHTWEMVHAGRYVAGGSRVLDYGWVGP